MSTEEKESGATSADGQSARGTSGRRGNRKARAIGQRQHRLTQSAVSEDHGSCTSNKVWRFREFVLNLKDFSEVRFSSILIFHCVLYCRVCTGLLLSILSPFFCSSDEFSTQSHSTGQSDLTSRVSLPLFYSNLK